MKVIFLDIDGVINCDRTPNPRKFPYIVDKRLLARLRKVLKETGAKVVLTSTWRCDPVGLLAAKHWKIPFTGLCPDKPKSPRCKEIRSWLAAHPNVKRYAVLDDEDDGLDGLPLFQPSKDTGLTAEMAKGLVLYLNGKTDEDMRASAIRRASQNIKALFQRNKS